MRVYCCRVIILIFKKELSDILDRVAKIVGKTKESIKYFKSDTASWYKQLAEKEKQRVEKLERKLVK